MQLQYAFSGPLALPEIMERYDKLIPNYSEREYARIESQTANRLKIESDFAQASIEQARESQAQARLGLNMGFAMVVIAMFVAIVFVLLDQAVLAGATVISDLVALGGLFVYGSRSKNQS